MRMMISELHTVPKKILLKKVQLSDLNSNKVKQKDRQPPGGFPLQLTSLNADCLNLLAPYLGAADLARFMCSSRVVAEAIRSARMDLVSCCAMLIP